MILILSACLMITALIAWYVIWPLLDPKLSTRFEDSYKGFASEDELVRMLTVRDHLLARLSARAVTDPEIAKLPLDQCEDMLVSLCIRFSRADLPVLPSEPWSYGVGKALIAVLIFVTTFGAHRVASAQLAPPAAPVEQQSAPNPNLPPLETIDGKNYPILNQYVLSPRQGELGVYYLTLFRVSPELKSITVTLPFPKGIQSLQIVNNPNASVTAAGELPSVTLPIVNGQGEIRAEFTLSAATGSVEWRNRDIPKMMGTTIIVSPKYEGALRGLVSKLLPTINLWPMTVVNGAKADEIAGFQAKVEAEELNPKDPNFEAAQKFPQFNTTFFRRALQPEDFPSFEVVGLVPSRTPLVVLSLLFGGLLFGIAGWVTVRFGKDSVTLPTVASTK